MDLIDQELLTLRQELTDRHINFIDGFGETKYIFDFIKKTICGELTNWKEINIKEAKNYENIADINEDYYDGNYNDGNYKHMMAIIYKVSIYKSFIHAKRKYIFMIIDNPYYNLSPTANFEKSKYKLIIFNINIVSVYLKFLTENSIFSSL